MDFFCCALVGHFYFEDCCMLVGFSGCCDDGLWIARLGPYHRFYGLGKLSWLTSGL